MTAADGPVAILIVETDQIVSLVTADMLADVGFRTIEVRTASEALSVLKRSDDVRVLITGRSIAGDGVALAQLVRHRWPAIGIIVTSGAGGDFERALPPGTRLLRKPYHFADVIREVEAELSREKEEPSAAPMLPIGLPPRSGMELGIGIGIGAVAAPVAEPDKT
ncbi:response regulator [Methylobacterium sp. WL122]|nr:response regulator [Methylobacterium sp. WL122]